MSIRITLNNSERLRLLKLANKEVRLEEKSMRTDSASVKRLASLYDLINKLRIHRDTGTEK